MLCSSISQYLPSPGVTLGHCRSAVLGCVRVDASKHFSSQEEAHVQSNTPKRSPHRVLRYSSILSNQAMGKPTQSSANQRPCCVGACVKPTSVALEQGLQDFHSGTQGNTSCKDHDRPAQGYFTRRNPTHRKRRIGKKMAKLVRASEAFNLRWRQKRCDQNDKQTKPATNACNPSALLNSQGS